MAIDQKEALIAVVRAQVEKEKAEKAEKLKREQEALKLSGKKVEVKKENGEKPKYKTLSAEELAEIKEKKRRKKAEELGIDLEEFDKQISAEVANAMKKEEEIEKEKEKEKATKTEQAEKKDAPKSSLKLKGQGSSKPKKDDVKVIDENDNASFTEDGKVKIISDDNNWDENKKVEESKKDDDDEIISIVPNMGEKGGDIKSMYDIDDEDDVLGAELSRFASFDEPIKKKADKDTKKASGAKKAEEELKKQEEKQRKAEEAEARKAEEAKMAEAKRAEAERAEAFKKAEEARKAEEAKKAEARKAEMAKKAEKARAIEEAKKAEEARIAEESLKAEEAKRKKLAEAEKKAEQQARRIAEAEAKKRAEEVARKRAAEAEEKKLAEEAKKRAIEEERQRAAEEAFKKAEIEYREKLKKEATEKVNAVKAKISEASAKLETAKKDCDLTRESIKQLGEKNAADKYSVDEEIKNIEAEENEIVQKIEADKAAAYAKAEENANAKLGTIKTELEEANNVGVNLKRLAESAGIAVTEAKAKKSEAIQAEKSAVDELNEKKAELEKAKSALEEVKKILADAELKVNNAIEVEKECSVKVVEATKAREIAEKNETSAVNSETEAKKNVAENDEKVKAINSKISTIEDEKQKLVTEADKVAETEAAKAVETITKKKADTEAKKKAIDDAFRAAEKSANDKLTELQKVVAECEKVLADAKNEEAEAIKAVEAAENAKLDTTKPIESGKLPLAAIYLEKYANVKSFGANLVDTFNTIVSNPENDNVVLFGDHGFGLTAVGEDFARCFFDMGIIKNKTIAKIKAAALNKVKLADAMYKLKGGCLVVENAGIIAKDKFQELVKLSAKNQNDVAIVLTGEKEAVIRLLSEAGDANKGFDKQIEMVGLSNSDMLEIARGYISQMAYTADSTVDGAIRNGLMAMESGNVDRMLKAIDDAMIKCDQREKAKGNEGKKYLLGEDFK